MRGGAGHCTVFLVTWNNCCKVSTPSNSCKLVFGSLSLNYFDCFNICCWSSSGFSGFQAACVYGLKRRGFFSRRMRFINGIPGFWVEEKE